MYPNCSRIDPRAAVDRKEARSELKLHADSPTALNTVTAYGSGFIEVNQIRHSCPLLIAPDRPVEPWDVAGFDTLTADDFARLRDRAPELVLLGTGARQRFPHPQLVRPLTDARIGCESMTSQAACRTYNILMGEGRKVLAALLLDD
jgi:uncharacterized protein